jgi:hypothetical protein
MLCSAVITEKSMSGSVNDKAADLSAKYREAKDAVMLLRQKERRGDWTSYQLMLDEAMGIAHDGLRNAWVMADRVRQLAKEAAALADKSDV